MIIGELDCRDFGCLHEKKIALSPGINLITGGNEAGKSTAVSFLCCMLYGMRRSRGRNSFPVLLYCRYEHDFYLHLRLLPCVTSTENQSSK